MKYFVLIVVIAFGFVFIADSPQEGINQAEQFFDTVSKSFMFAQFVGEN